MHKVRPTYRQQHSVTALGPVLIVCLVPRAYSVTLHFDIDTQWCEQNTGLNLVSSVSHIQKQQRNKQLDKICIIIKHTVSTWTGRRKQTGGLSTRKMFVDILNAVADLEFPRGGGANPKWGGGCQPIIWPIFPKNCMKMKKFWARGGARPSPPPSPPPPQSLDSPLKCKNSHSKQNQVTRWRCKCSKNTSKRIRWNEKWNSSVA